MLVEKYMDERKHHCYTLEAYKKMPVFITVDITENVFKFVAQKLLVSVVTGGMDSEALQGWVLKFGYHSKKRVLVWNLLWTVYPIGAHHGRPIGHLFLTA